MLMTISSPSLGTLISVPNKNIFPMKDLVTNRKSIHLESSIISIPSGDVYGVFFALLF
jgi:hypothetical protein